MLLPCLASIISHFIDYKLLIAHFALLHPIVGNWNQLYFLLFLSTPTCSVTITLTHSSIPTYFIFETYVRILTYFDVYVSYVKLTLYVVILLLLNCISALWDREHLPQDLTLLYHCCIIVYSIFDLFATFVRVSMSISISKTFRPVGAWRRRKSRVRIGGADGRKKC